MSRPATTRLKVNPPLGSLPVLQYCAPDQLRIDPTYQRSLETGPSQTLVRRIAMFWNWDLCQPLVVARRADGGLYVVDGQHRLAAAALRRDIAQLPCVLNSYAAAADEAAAFVALNQCRRPLNALDIFKASLAAEDAEAVAIKAALGAAGLSLSSTTNNQLMKPDSVFNIGGLQACYRAHGATVLTNALTILQRSYPGQVLRYAGSIFPGVVAIVLIEMDGFKGDDWLTEAEFVESMLAMISGATQAEWFADIVAAIANDVRLGRRKASIEVFKAAWGEFLDGYFDEDFNQVAAA